MPANAVRGKVFIGRSELSCLNALVVSRRSRPDQVTCEAAIIYEHQEETAKGVVKDKFVVVIKSRRGHQVMERRENPYFFQKVEGGL